MNKKTRGMTFDEELEATIAVAQIKEWIDDCPKKCPLANCLSLFVAAVNDREKLKFHLKMEKDD